MTMAQKLRMHREMEQANKARIAAWSGKLVRVYMFGGYGGKADDDDYVIGYLYRGQYIDIKMAGFYEHSGKLYMVDGFGYSTLREAKAACN